MISPRTGRMESPPSGDHNIASSLASGQLCDFWYVVMTFLINREIIVLAGTCRRLRKLVSDVIPSRLTLHDVVQQSVGSVSLFSHFANTDYSTYLRYTIECKICGELLCSTNQLHVYLLTLVKNIRHCGHMVIGLQTEMKTNAECRWIVYTGSAPRYTESDADSAIRSMIIHGTNADLRDVQIEKIEQLIPFIERVITATQSFCNTIASINGGDSDSDRAYQERWINMPYNTRDACHQLVRRYRMVQDIKNHGVDVIARFMYYLQLYEEYHT